MQSDNIRYNFLSEDLPELYGAASTASLKAQKNHLRIIKGYLVLLVEKPVKLTILGRFKLTRSGRSKLTTLGRSKLTTLSD